MIKLFIIFTLLLNAAYAEAPRHKTRQNEVTDMFDKEIEDKGSVEQMIEDSKVQAEQGISNKESLKTLNLKENELISKTTELNSINANSLESAGQQERVKEENAYYDALEIDYTDPQIINHHKDMNKILSASDRLMGRLIEGLKELGVDCKTVKGDKEIEPEMYLDIEQEQQKDTVYDQKICEELRNRYNCNDEVTLKCTKTGIRYTEWQDKEITFTGHEVYWQHLRWCEGIKWKDSRFGIHMRKFDWVVADVRQAIAKKLEKSLEQIHEQVGIDARGVGSIFHLEGKSYTWEKFIFKYKYRDTYPVCEVWNESWDERCRLQ